MAHFSKSSSSLFPVKQQHPLHTCILHAFFVFVLLSLNLSHASSLNFSFPSGFKQTDEQNPIVTRNDAYVDGDGVLQLTKNARNSQINGSVGRASYFEPILLWDNSTSTKWVADFTTHFKFNINIDGDRSNFFGDGITFFLTPFDDSSALAPPNTEGGSLGLVNMDAHGVCNTTSTNINPFVAVEFDTFKNEWDPSNDHIGVDINCVVSRATYLVPTSMKNNATANAWITYNSSTNNLNVFLTYDPYHIFSSGDSNLSYSIDLTTVLPQKVRVGFSGATGANTEIHEILSWDFHSTLPDRDNMSAPEPVSAPSMIPKEQNAKGQSKAGLVAGIVAGFGVLMLGLGLFGLLRWHRRSGYGQEDENHIDLDDDDDFEIGTAPRKFTYRELSHATNNFAEEGKLGEGGFGGVYKGFLTDLSTEIAVKKISKGSKQGKKEYMSEVKIISRLRHRNLVQLLGWCHDQGELLLVYEFMPNGSLDSHLYGTKKAPLSWPVRYRIALGLSSALLYLHELWEQCVVHRDIKSSNIMLDSYFNAKLGDFGLARLIDHELGSQTTALAGTLGYLAPECAITGKASRESDVYSFGAVALEIACGRRPTESMEEPGKVGIVEWIWDLYGKDRLVEAVDKSLEGEFNIQQIKCLMVVGLWCSHPDHTSRPSIRQAFNVLSLEAPLPCLPSKFPVLTYIPPINMDVISITSSLGGTGSSGTTKSSSQSNVSVAAALLSPEANAF